jgi:hypothetical protein
VPDWAVRVTGSSKSELLVLSQFAYWFGLSNKTDSVRAKTQKEGYYWVFKSYKQLARETSLTRDAVRGAVRELCRKGILVSRPFDRGSLPYYRLDSNAIARAIEEAGRWNEDRWDVEDEVLEC